MMIKMNSLYRNNKKKILDFLTPQRANLPHPSKAILDRLKCADQLGKKIKDQVKSFLSIDFRAESQGFFSSNIYIDQTHDELLWFTG